MPNYAKLAETEEKYNNFYDAALEAITEMDTIRHNYSHVANVILIGITIAGIIINNVVAEGIELVAIASTVCGIIGIVRLIIRAVKMRRVKNIKKISIKGMVETQKLGWLLQNSSQN